MKSTKERDKRVGKKPQRKTNGDDLRRALNWILIDDIFAHMRLHGNVKWKPLALVLHFPRKPIGEQAPADEISPPHLRGRKLPQPWSVR